MKSFLEEYGFAILAAIVVILLIAMSTPVGNLIKAQIMGMVDKFANTADKKLDSSASGEYVAMIVGGAAPKLIITGPSSTNTYSYVVHGLIKNAEDTTQKGSKVTAETAAAGIDLTAAVNTYDANSQYYVVVTNDGTGETFQSNIIVK